MVAADFHFSRFRVIGVSCFARKELPEQTFDTFSGFKDCFVTFKRKMNVYKNVFVYRRLRKSKIPCFLYEASKYLTDT